MENRLILGLHITHTEEIWKYVSLTPLCVKDGCLDMTGFDEEFAAFDNILAANLEYEQVLDGDVVPRCGPDIRP